MLIKSTLLARVAANFAERFSEQRLPLESGRSITLYDAVQRLNDRRLDHDEVLRSLIGRTQDGSDEGAQLALLVAFRPKLAHFVGSVRAIARLSLDERNALVVGAFLEQVRRHPLDRCGRGVASRLTLDTLHRLTRYREDSANEVTVGDAFWLHVEDAPEPGDLTVELYECLSWALETRALSRAEVRILATVELGTEADRSELAEEFRVQPPSLHRRAQRIRAKLAEAISSRSAA